MSEAVYLLQRSNIIAGRELGILSVGKAIQLLVRLENRRAGQAIQEARAITLNRKGKDHESNQSSNTGRRTPDKK